MDPTFQSLLEKEALEISGEAQKRVLSFYDLVRDENQRQNLTRMIEPRDFIEGHLQDVLELHEMGVLGEKNLDLGSGAGVPGLLSAAIVPRRWVLAESEKMKALFLEKAVQEMELSDWVQIHSGRAENYLKDSESGWTVVSRAVGTVEKIWTWIESCSTWNRLVLFKGPKWEEEWKEFQKKPSRAKALRVSKIHTYEVGLEKKSRKIILLERVPRGT